MRGYIALLVWLLMVVPVSGTTYHVAKTGLDTVACGLADYTAAARAKLTVSAGKNCATNPGDVVMIHPGTYVENPTMTSSGTTGNPITIQASTGDARETVIVQGNMVISAASWVTLRGFTVTQQSVSIIGNSSNIDLLDMRVVNAPSYAFNINSSGGATISNVLVENCEAHSNGSTGVRGSPDIVAPTPYFIAKYNITVRNCLIHDNGEDGIAMSNVDGILLENNTIYNHVEDGIDIKQGSKNIVIQHNTIYDNTNAGIMINPVHSSIDPPFTGGEDFIIEGNTVYNNGNQAGSVDGDSQIRINSAGVPTGRSMISNNVLIGSTRAVTDGLSVFRGTKIDIYNNTIRNVTRYGILGRCYRDGAMMDNIIDGQDRVFSAEGSSADCTGYANDLLTEDYNLLRTTGSSLIRWTTGTAYATLALYQAGTSQGAHSLSANPQFTSTTNSTLLATSPAIDTGICLAAVTADRMGIVRPMGLSCDMGAYEFVSGVPPAPLPGIVLFPAPTQVGSILQGGSLQGGARQ